MRKLFGTIILVLILLAVVAGFIFFDLSSYLSFSYLSSKQETLSNLYSENKYISIGLYFGVYVLLTAFSLPGSTIMTLAGGAIFGLFLGITLTSFASTIGATIAFLLSRFIARDYVQRRFGNKISLLNKCIEEDGGHCLFTVRLIPAFPFFVVNLLMGLTPIRTSTFFWVSQLGMLPATIVYVNAGTELSKLESAAGILSPSVIFSFLLLAGFPLVVKKVMQRVTEARKQKMA